MIDEDKTWQRLRRLRCLKHDGTLDTTAYRRRILLMMAVNLGEQVGGQAQAAEIMRAVIAGAKVGAK